MPSLSSTIRKTGFHRAGENDAQYSILVGILFLSLLSLFSITGCRIHSQTCVSDSTFVDSLPGKTELEAVDIESINPIRIPLVDDREKGKVPEAIESVYPLTLRDCEWLAAQRSPLARVLDIESRHQMISQECSSVDPCVRQAAIQAISSNADYQRNIQSEQALLAYLGLVEVYLQNQIIEETLAEIEELQKVLYQLQDEGLLKEVDPEYLVRKRLDAIEKQNDLLFNYEKLNSNLRTLLGLKDSIHPIWTDCQISKWEIPSDLQNELESAFSNRADLHSLSQLANTPNDQILDTLRGSVRSASPLAGLVLEKKLFGGLFSDNSAEISKLRAQTQILQEAQMDLVKSQVTEHYFSIQKDHEQIQVNLARLKSLQKSETRLEALRQIGPVKVDEVLTIKAEMLQSRSDIVHAAVELQRSWIKLKAAQGMLGRTADTSPENSLQPAG